MDGQGIKADRCTGCTLIHVAIKDIRRHGADIDFRGSFGALRVGGYQVELYGEMRLLMVASLIVALIMNTRTN